jgi:CHASE2 domain-containing sensor protein
MSPIIRDVDLAFCGSELQGRRPIERTYLARLISSIAFYRPSAVAVDFDFTLDGAYSIYKTGSTGLQTGARFKSAESRE